MDMTDIQCELFTNSGPAMGMKLTHLPTGLSVAGTGNLRARLRAELGEELRVLIEDEHE